MGEILWVQVPPAAPKFGIEPTWYAKTVVVQTMGYTGAGGFAVQNVLVDSQRKAIGRISIVGFRKNCAVE
jgi:hypothetical protein